MRAVQIHRHGGIEQLEYENVAVPKIDANEVLVEVKACALNHLDLWIRKGLRGVPIQLPLIPGSDVSGVVAEVGELVEGVSVGDKVLLAPGISTGKSQEELAGAEYLSPNYRLLGLHLNGGCADFVKVPGSNVIPIPAGLTFVEAASVPLVFMTAWHMVVSRAKVQPGEDVLVLGAGSGVGTAAIQIAKLFGARVITTIGIEEKRSKAYGIGADDVINYNKQDIYKEVMKLTKDRGVDVVIEHVGPKTWEQSMLSLARNGRLVTCGATTGPFVKLDLRYLFTKHLTILGSYMGSKAELIEALKYMPNKLAPVVDRVLELKEIRTAHKILEDRQQFGKVVLTPSKSVSKKSRSSKTKKTGRSRG